MTRYPHCLAISGFSTLPAHFDLRRSSPPTLNLSLINLASRSLAIRHRSAITGNTIPIAEWILYIVERQIPILRTIAPIDRRTPTRLTLMLQHLIRQRLDLRKCQVGASLQVIWKRANASGADCDVEFVIPAGGLASAGCINTLADVGADGDGFGRGDADYVLALGVRGRQGFGGGVDGVAEDLDDGFGILVFESGEGTEAGAAAVESEGGDGGDDAGDTGDGEERSEGCGGMHSNVMKKGLGRGKEFRPGVRAAVAGSCLNVILSVATVSRCCGSVFE